MTEEIIIDEEDKTKKHRNNEIDCLHFSCRKGESGKVLLWCDFYDDHCDNYTGCYYRKNLRLEQENKELKKQFADYENDIEDWVSDNSILYQYDDRSPDTLEELQCCMEETHKEWHNYRSALEEIKKIIKSYDLTVDNGASVDTLYTIRKIINEVLNK